MARRTRRPRGLVRATLIAVLVLLASLAAGAGPASAQGSGYFVTFVARSCTSYADIYANRARNDIQESLEDLGPNTQYKAGELVSPTAEGIAPQNKCEPLPGWEFTLGRGIEGRAVTGPWGSLSKVTNPFSRAAPIVTQDQTVLPNQNGTSVDDQQLTGATTIELTDQERTQATTSQLWVQGGTPTDPVLAGKFPGPKYAFGALRCGNDYFNGDNVEFIFFPANTTHVFCFAFYVTPPPTSGTITIKKQVDTTAAPPGPPPVFGFDGDISFDPGGFRLGHDGSKDFYRAGGPLPDGGAIPTWTVTEDPAANYELTHLSCSGLSGVTISGHTASIHLLARDHVTCVYHNRYVPPHGGLTIRKVSLGGIGSFAYTVSPVSGHGEVHDARATTAEPDIAVDAEPSPLRLSPGSYQIHERSPSSPAGRWHLRSVDCNPAESTRRPVEVHVESGHAVTCTFVNVFVPRGSISISKLTDGATGTATFLVTPIRGVPAQYLQSATTTAQGLAAPAIPHAAANATAHLRLGSYRIVEQLPAKSPAGDWTLTAVDCNGALEPFAQGTADVTLTATHPHVHCLFIDTFSATPPPLPPEPPNPPPVTPPAHPPPPGVGPEPIFPAIPARPEFDLADLVVTKRASAPIVSRGDVVSFRITVKNRGPDPAQRVVVGDKELGAATLLKAQTSAGSCTLRPVATCRLGTIKPGRMVTVTVRIRVLTRASTLTDVAVAGTATQDQTFADNVARARVVVRPRRPAPAPLVTG